MNIKKSSSKLEYGFCYVFVGNHSLRFELLAAATSCTVDQASDQALMREAT